MKKYLLFLLSVVMAAVSSVSLVSCGKDDVVHTGKTIVVYSIVGGWSKWLSGNTIIGCRFDANGDAYFDTWTTSPSWKDPGKWTVSGNLLTVKSQEEEVIFTCRFLVTEEGKSIIITNVQTVDEWQFLRDLEGELPRMQIKEVEPEE